MKPKSKQRTDGEANAHATDKAQTDLERLLERITSGSIEDIDELQPQDLELLRGYYGDGEDLQDILDRLRGDESERS